MERNSVRRCTRCQAPEIIIINRWETRFLGVLPLRNSQQTEHECRSCGARFSLRPPLFLFFVVGAFSGTASVGIGGTAIVGAPIALAAQGPAEALVVLVVGVVALALGLANLKYVAGPQVHAWRNPLVPGAEMPELSLGPPKGYRMCTCGTPAHRVSQRVHSISLLPAGTDSNYLCPGCGREFSVPDLWAVVTGSAFTLFLGGIGALLGSLLPFEDLKGDHIFILGILGMGALGGALLVAFGVYQRARYPVV